MKDNITYDLKKLEKQLRNTSNFFKKLEILDSQDEILHKLKDKVKIKKKYNGQKEN